MTPDAHEGDVKLVSPLTLENIADSVIAEGLATRGEIDAVLDELDQLASDAANVIAIPRIVQAWAYRARPRSQIQARRLGRRAGHTSAG